MSEWVLVNDEGVVESDFSSDESARKALHTRYPDEVAEGSMRVEKAADHRCEDCGGWIQDCGGDHEPDPYDAPDYGETIRDWKVGE